MIPAFEDSFYYLQKERQLLSSATAKPGQMREGVALAVRLAELIQMSEPGRER